MNGSVLRLLDANFNRAREALRVMEDCARFVLNDKLLRAELKQLRHEYTSVIAKYVGSALLHRDSPGDLRIHQPAEAEFRRADIADVITAAGKRLGEGLRTIEEYLKIDDPADAAAIEKIRYRSYELEQKLTVRMYSARKKFASVRLCVLITENACKKPWMEVAEQAILGGADCLQLREKELRDELYEQRARLLVFLCRQRGVISIINDRPDIAIISGADGVHVGQHDLPVGQVRKLLGSEKIVGVSTHKVMDAQLAVMTGADYIGVGPVYRSSTKPREWKEIPGLAYAREAAAAVKIPAVAIAGITLQNVDEVLATGVQAIAVTAAVCGADDPRSAAAALKERITGFQPVRSSLDRAQSARVENP